MTHLSMFTKGDDWYEIIQQSVLLQRIFDGLEHSGPIMVATSLSDRDSMTT